MPIQIIIYYPSNWTQQQISDYELEIKDNFRRVCGITKSSAVQYYPKGMLKTKWEEIIWGFKYWLN